MINRADSRISKNIADRGSAADFGPDYEEPRSLTMAPLVLLQDLDCHSNSGYLLFFDQIKVRYFGAIRQFAYNTDNANDSNL